MQLTKLTSTLLICTLLVPKPVLADVCLRPPLITKAKDIELEKELFSLERLKHTTANRRAGILLLMEFWISKNKLPKEITEQANEILEFFYNHPVVREFKQEDEKIKKALSEGKLDKQMIAALQKSRSTKEQIELVKSEIELTIQIRDRVKKLLESCINYKETDWYKILQNANSLITFRLSGYDPQKGLMQKKSYPIQLRKLKDSGYHIFDYLYNYYKVHISNLTFATTDDCPMVMSTEDSILEIIGNLILNSIQAEANTITVTCKSDDDPTKVAIIVEDDGHGIPQENRNKIFEPWESTKGKFRGLGLAIVKGIVEKHGGTVSVDSLTPKEHKNSVGLTSESNRGYLDKLVQAIGSNPSLAEFAQGTHEEIAGYYEGAIAPMKEFLKDKESLSINEFLNLICAAMSSFLIKTADYTHKIKEIHGKKSINMEAIGFIIDTIGNKTRPFHAFKELSDSGMDVEKIVEKIIEIIETSHPELKERGLTKEEELCELTKLYIHKIDGAIETYRRVAFGERLSVGTTFTILLPAAGDGFPAPNKSLESAPCAQRTKDASL